MATAAKAEVRAPGPTTVEELMAWMDAPPGEIVDGVWVPKYREGEVTGTGVRHGIVTMRLGRLVADFVERQRLGVTLCAEAGFRLRRRPDTMRCPDVAFVAADRLRGGIPDGVFEGAPDLAAEVLSPTNTAAEIQQKLVDHLRYGTRAVWIVDPVTRTIAVHVAGGLPRWCERDDLLDGGDVLPGFAVPTATVFADLDPPG